MVALKPNKADAGSPAVGQGVVYRLKVSYSHLRVVGYLSLCIVLRILMAMLCLNKQDSSITVVFDDIPEDGLNSPLRLEKLANEVLQKNPHGFIVELHKLKHIFRLAPLCFLIHDPLFCTCTPALSYRLLIPLLGYLPQDEGCINST